MRKIDASTFRHLVDFRVKVVNVNEGFVVHGIGDTSEYSPSITD